LDFSLSISRVHLNLVCIEELKSDGFDMPMSKYNDRSFMVNCSSAFRPLSIANAWCFFTCWCGIDSWDRQALPCRFHKKQSKTCCI